MGNKLLSFVALAVMGTLTTGCFGYGDQEDAAFRLAEFHKTKSGKMASALGHNASGYGCDDTYGFKLIDPQYGYITHDMNEYYQPVKLQSPVDAIMTGVEFVCQNNTRGSKNKVWTYLVVAYDAEFDKYRCQKAVSATEYAADGNTPIGYDFDQRISRSSNETPRTRVEAFARDCGFTTR